MEAFLAVYLKGVLAPISVPNAGLTCLVSAVFEVVLGEVFVEVWCWLLIQ